MQLQKNVCNGKMTEKSLVVNANAVKNARFE